MSKIDEYTDAKAGHDLLCEILEKTTPSIMVAYTQNDYHVVGFGFSEVDSAGRTIQKHTTTRLSIMLVKACGLRLPGILQTAREMSQDDVELLARAARAEAIETLQTIKVEKGVSNA